MMAKVDRIIRLYMKDAIPYELGMARYAHNQIISITKFPTTPDELRRINLQIEGFALHARNLIDFFYNHGQSSINNKRGNLGAWRFVLQNTPMATKRNLSKATERLYDLMHDQVLHLGRGRKSTARGKFGTKKIIYLMKQIKSQARIFDRDLDPGYKAHAPGNFGLPQPAKVTLTGRASATNRTIMVSWTGPAAPHVPSLT